LGYITDKSRSDWKKLNLHCHALKANIFSIWSTITWPKLKEKEYSAQKGFNTTFDRFNLTAEMHLTIKSNKNWFTIGFNWKKDTFWVELKSLKQKWVFITCKKIDVPPWRAARKSLVSRNVAILTLRKKYENFRMNI